MKDLWNRIISSISEAVHKIIDKAVEMKDKLVAKFKEALDKGKQAVVKWNRKYHFKYQELVWQSC